MKTTAEIAKTFTETEKEALAEVLARESGISFDDAVEAVLLRFGRATERT